MAVATAGETFEAVYARGLTGQAGIVAFRIDDGEGNTVFGPTQAGIIELGATGVYSHPDTPTPGTAGQQYTLMWSRDGSWDAVGVFVDDLYIIAPAGAVVPTPLPIDSAGGGGPCQMWTTVEAVAECCGASSDDATLDSALLAAVQTLYLLSAKRYAGQCERTVRPCGTSGCAGPWGAWMGAAWIGYNFGVYGAWGGAGVIAGPSAPDDYCGCQPLSRVYLPGRARAITEVKIDGLVLSDDEYRLDEHRWLTRLPDADGNDQWWPSCQNMALPDTEDGTFSVTYTYGTNPPESGVLAARELACAIHQSCAGGGDLDECQLPNGVVKIDRAGLTIELSGMASWAFSKNPKGNRPAGWHTGLPLTDMFLNAVNPDGRRRRRSTVWSPDMPKMPRTVGA